MDRIPLMKPRLSEDVKKRVLDVLESGHWTEGPVTEELERCFAAYTDTRHAVAATSCTTGLEMALRALEVGPGDEVIVPDFTYPATAAVVRLLGARVVLVDVDPQSMLIDPEALEQALGERTRAIVPVSIFGNPLDWDHLGQLRQRTGIPIVEDAACSIGARWRDRPVGCFADVTAFSLHPRKFITTGEGGMLTTDDEALADRMWSFKHFGMERHPQPGAAPFVRIGTNYKLSNILAAVGLAQMAEIEVLLQRRLELSDRYTQLLAGRPGVQLQATPREGLHSRQSFCIRVGAARDRILSELRERGIEVQIGTFSLHQQPAFRESADCVHHGSLRGSASCSAEALVLPLFHDLTAAQQERVVSELLARL